MINYLQIKDEAEWLKKRNDYITSTECAALFGLSPWTTAFELYHLKRGLLESPVKDDNFLAFGRIIEEPVCQMVMIEHPDWKIMPMRVFAYDDEDKFGASFDRVVTLSDGSVGLLEVKSISYKEYKKKFIEHAADDIEAPENYEIQMQAQLEVIRRYNFCLMAVFVLDTRELKYIYRYRDTEMGAKLREAVKSFWAMTEPPEPDYSMDKALIAKLMPAADPDKTLDATEDTRITELAAMYKGEKELEKQSKDNADKFYAELMHLLGNTRYAWTNSHKITVSDIKPNEGKEITEDMVGQRIGAKSGYKKLTITEVKK